jgi:hypothetical protein
MNGAGDMNTGKLLCCIGVLLVALAGPSQAFAQDGDDLKAPPLQDGPIEVQTGFLLFDISAVDEKEESIAFEGGINMLWKDPGWPTTWPRWVWKAGPPGITPIHPAGSTRTISPSRSCRRDGDPISVSVTVWATDRRT